MAIEDRLGERLFTLRKEAELTQKKLADILGVTEKAVSRWENGGAKPGRQTLKKLAALFDVPMEELLSLKGLLSEKKITKIVLTGGPCAGKTTALSQIKKVLTKRGYCVLIIPETATELILGGVAPWTCDTNYHFQEFQMRLQLEKERLYSDAAKYMNEEKVLIICDRGALDNLVYMEKAEFSRILRSLGTNEVELRDTYDAVFHLVTAAKGALKAYTTANNGARKESPEEASALDDKLISAWTGHPHLRVIDNSTGFKDKIRRVTAEILSFLGEPEPLEIERKFLIRYPDISWLENQSNCKKVEIIQTYLYSGDDEEVRVRQRGSDGHFVYFETIKKKAGGKKRIEIERRLSYEEYLSRLLEADVHMRPVRKTRYCLTWENQYFEIDVYPFWDDRAILEIELRDEDQKIRIPDNIEVVREVTDEEAYKNSSLAVSIPTDKID